MKKPHIELWLKVLLWVIVIGMVAVYVAFGQICEDWTLRETACPAGLESVCDTKNAALSGAEYDQNTINSMLACQAVEAGSSGDITDVWTCSTGDCDALTAAAGDSLNASSADATAPAKVGTAAPGTCQVGYLFFDSDASAGLNLYGCTSSDVWTLLGDGGGGGGTITVEEADSSPSVANVDTIQFDQADGFTVTDEGGGQVQIDVTHTVDTNANTICSGTNTYLDGQGDCDTVGGDLSGGLDAAVVGNDSHDHSAAGSTVTINAADIIDTDAGTDITADLEEEGEIGSATISGSAIDHAAIVGTGSGTASWTGAIPDCHSNSMLTFTQSTNTWGCDPDDGAGGGAPVGAQYVVGASDATLTAEKILTDGQGIDTVISGGDAGSATIDLKYTDTLAGDPAYDAEECTFTTDGTGGGGFICEGTAANTNEQRYLFPAVDGADTTTFITVDTDQVTDIDGNGLSISGGQLSVGAGVGLYAFANTMALSYTATADPVLSSDYCTFTDNGGSPGGLVCEGATADTIETRLVVTDPTTTDKTITFPNATGEVSLLGQTIDLSSGEVTNVLPVSKGGTNADNSGVVADAEILVYDGVTDNAFESVPMSGDVTISAAGVATVANDSHDHSAAGSTVTINAADIIDLNANTDITADLEEEDHSSEHHNGGGDAITHDSLATPRTATAAAADTIDDIGEIDAAIKRGPDATDTHILTTDVSAPGSAECLEMDTDGSVILAGGACGTSSADSFKTHDAPDGTDPVADTATDTLTWSVTAPLVLTGGDDPETMAFTWSGTMPDAQIDGSAESDEIAAGSDGQVQYNNGGSALGGAAGLTYNDSTGLTSFTRLSEGASVPVGRFYGSDRTTPTDNDEIFLYFFLEDDFPGYQEFARISVVATDVTNFDEDSALTFDVVVDGSPTEGLRLKSDLTSSVQAQLPSYGSGNLTGTDAYWLAVDSSGNIIEEAAPGGTGDVTDVGDCDGPACFNGSEGTTLTFETAGAADITLAAASSAAGSAITLPDETGTVCTTASICSGTVTYEADTHATEHEDTGGDEIAVTGGMMNADFGDFSCDGTATGCAVDANALTSADINEGAAAWDFSSTTTTFLANDIDSSEINTEVRSMYWPAGSLSSDGTQCADPAEVTLASNPKTYTIICADNNASAIYGQAVMPDSWNGGTVVFELSYTQTAADTSDFNGGVFAQCRGAGETIGSYGSEQTINDAAVTGSNAVDMTESSAVTPAGTCAGGDILFWKYEVEDTTDTAMATLHILGMKMEYTSNVGD